MSIQNFSIFSVMFLAPPLQEEEQNKMGPTIEDVTDETATLDKPKTRLTERNITEIAKTELSSSETYLNKFGSYLENLVNRICNFLKDLLPFLWPLPPKNKNPIPTARELLTRAANRYQGKKETEVPSVNVIRIPRYLRETKIVLIPQEYREKLTLVQKISPLFHIFQIAKTFNRSPINASINLHQIQNTFNSLVYKLGGKSPSNDELRLKDEHDAMCQRFGEMTDLAISFTVSDPLLAESIGAVAQGSILLVANFPEVNGKIKETLRNIKCYLGVKDLDAKLIVPQRQHTNSCQRMINLSKIAIYFSVSDPLLAHKMRSGIQLSTLFAANFPEIQNYVPEVPFISKTLDRIDQNLTLIRQNVKDRMVRPLIKKYVMPKVVEGMISLFEKRGSDILETIKNIIENPESDPETVETLKYIVETAELVNDGFNDGKKVFDKQDSYSASILSTLIDYHLKEPTEQVLAKGLEMTEQLIAEIPMALTVYTIKSIAWSYIDPGLPIATLNIATNGFFTGTVIKIASPALSGAMMVAGGGFEQGIGELAVRTSGVALMLLTGSSLAGSALIYGCLAVGYGIDLRQKHLERNGIEDPIITWFQDNILGKENPIVEKVVEEILDPDYSNDKTKEKQEEASMIAADMHGCLAIEDELYEDNEIVEETKKPLNAMQQILLLGLRKKVMLETKNGTLPMSENTSLRFSEMYQAIVDPDYSKNKAREEEASIIATDMYGF